MAKKSKQKGKKGGISAVSPEVVGAVTGAVIGGMTGLMLANKKTRTSLVSVKDKSLDSVGNILENVSINTTGVKNETEEITDGAKEKINKTLPKH
jgi:gas vesicle protein